MLASFFHLDWLVLPGTVSACLNSFREWLAYGSGANASSVACSFDGVVQFEATVGIVLLEGVTGVSAPFKASAILGMGGSKVRAQFVSDVTKGRRKEGKRKSLDSLIRFSGCRSSESMT
ncbi:hypothetical protein Q3G72_013457 [Acer saccharum]|nr:hypothetical protein Q3G72_013457 [Acer saccharum]